MWILTEALSTVSSVGVVLREDTMREAGHVFAKS